MNFIFDGCRSITCAMERDKNKSGPDRFCGCGVGCRRSTCEARVVGHGVVAAGWRRRRPASDLTTSLWVQHRFSEKRSDRRHAPTKPPRLRDQYGASLAMPITICRSAWRRPSSCQRRSPTIGRSRVPRPMRDLIGGREEATARGLMRRARSRCPPSRRASPACWIEIMRHIPAGRRRTT